MDQEERRVVSVDLSALETECEPGGVAWAYAGEDLNINLVVFEGHDGVEKHMNAEVDVLVLGMAGEGVVQVEGETYPVKPGQLLLIPKGLRRSLQSAGCRVAYLTCHRRRSGLTIQPFKTPG